MKRIVAGIFCSAVPSCAQDTGNASDAFYAAIRANDLARLQALLKQGADANAKDARGVTPLMQAAIVGSPEAMKLLLDNGADPNLTNTAGSTALMFSVTDIAKVRLLLDRGANVNAGFEIRPNAAAAGCAERRLGRDRATAAREGRRREGR